MNSRLVDYFFVAKWQKGLEQGGVLQPAIGDRFPLQDWDDYPLPNAAAMMALADGSPVVPGRAPMPSCYTFVMAAEDGSRVYGSCLVLWDKAGHELRQLAGDDDGVEMHTPRCLCLLSHWAFLATFQQAHRHDQSPNETHAPPPQPFHQLNLTNATLSSPRRRSPSSIASRCRSRRRHSRRT